MADDTGDPGVQDTARQGLELELTVLGDDGVPGVVAPLRADDHVGLLRQQVHQLSLPLVSPLSANDDDDHGELLTSVWGPDWCDRWGRGLPRPGASTSA